MTSDAPAAFSVRPFRPEDETALYRICLETGDSGADATELYADPLLLGHLYAAPYGRFEPELAFILEDAVSVCGYVVGARDTAAFNTRLEREWWPDLRARYPLSHADAPPHTPDERLIAQIHTGFPDDTGLWQAYPSHLHIDLLPRAQGAGNGRRLIGTLLGALRAANSPGVHLGVGARNERAIGFYRRLGFQELARTPGAVTFGMKLR
ncbi:GNAT family N-acetyltransferase [Deinococcus peraridilitoris]|uniref:Acetyltransferase n=1 Tax=Deinococcus peraridilitoris (strain DSM 19664 / LMG 22246 / CIP 109416 / KR-200) TaxID=937777 RepID=L0A0A3_DEIPD|nr:GNAT family N-acetyltransferase [Deinococcus peraridilitoris]AFZ67271.1 acetyltransferase [Deinococcus peraridilitoris DSM 19664]